MTALTSSDRIVACLFAAYTAYRLWSGWNVGMIDGDGDLDVSVEEHPTAFVLTALSIIFTITILVYFALGPDLPKLANFVAWLWEI
jgi:hypothetical protein